MCHQEKCPSLTNSDRRSNPTTKKKGKKANSSPCLGCLVGLEGDTPPCKGSQNHVHPTPGSWGVHEELAGGRLECQGGQSHHAPCQQPQACSMRPRNPGHRWRSAFPCSVRQDCIRCSNQQAVTCVCLCVCVCVCLGRPTAG